MKTTLEERVKKKLLKFGRKNRICGYLVLPLLVLWMFCFHVLAYIKGNGKRFAMIAMSFFLFVVYSSFSFPLFITGTMEMDPYNQLQSDSQVELAPESELNLEDVILLTDVEVLEEFEMVEDGDPYGMDGMDSYDTTEVLAALEGYGRQNDRQKVIPEQNPAVEREFSRDDWRLVLINKQHSIPEDYTFTLASFMNFKCDERILDDLADMFQAAKDDGINLEIRSPYRTHERQEYLFERKITLYMGQGMSYIEAYQLASKAVTIPGNSEHEIGLALDIECRGFTSLIQEFGDTEAGKWLAENSCKYGFIVRYPKGKEYVTGIEYEPWHFRYVGTEAAMLIKEQGITLEELWEDYL